MSAPSAPDEGVVLAVCLGPGGIPKQPVDEARVERLGLVGDGHRYHKHGGERRAVCLLSEEEVRALEGDGVDTSGGAGTFGENLLTRGLDYRRLKPGDVLAVGSVRLEIDDVRAPCATLRSVDKRFPDLMLGRSGFLARVLEEGTVRIGDAIRLEPAGNPQAAD